MELADLTMTEELNMKAKAALQFAIARSTGLPPDEVAETFAERMGPWARRQVTAWRTKAATAPLDSSSGLAPAQPYSQALVELADRDSFFGAVKRAGAIQVPPNVVGTLAAGGATAAWAGEAAAKLIAALSFSSASLLVRKLVLMFVLTRELMLAGDSRSQDIVTRAAKIAIANGTDTTALDATAASSSRPAGLLNGISATTLSGTIGEQVAIAVNALSGGAPTAPVVAVSLQTALRLQATVRDLEAIGVRVVVTPAATNRIIAVDAPGVLYVDGGLDIAISDQADVMMDSVPAEPDIATTVHVSLWQRNLRSVRCERILNWKARADAIAWGTAV
jgi:hypothetical protein